MKLLKKTIVYYFIFAALLFGAAVPLFYFALRSVVVSNADEKLRSVKTRIMPRLLDAAAGRENGTMDYSDYSIIYRRIPAASGEDSLYSIAVTGTQPGEREPGRAFSSHFVINQEWYSLEINTSMADKMALIKRIVWVLSGLLFVLLVGLLLINNTLSRKIWRPFYLTLERLGRYRVDQPDALTLPVAPVKEFNDLNQAIAGLTQRDRQAFNAQKEFAENASHEMQSPLAVFQSKLELLMQTRPLNEEQTQLITDLATASKRMSRLNKILILLTRIENNQFLEKETLSVSQMLDKLLEQYAFQVERQAITVTVNRAEDLLIHMNKTLLEILLGNLLSNAIRHNRPGGHILVTLSEHVVEIQNTGREMPLEQDKLFRRFQKESGDASSIGLGLEIVQKICRLNHFEIRYAYHDSLHSFRISFP